MIQISQIKTDAHIKDQKKALDHYIQKKLGLKNIPAYDIVKKSLDARHKPQLFYVYTVNVHLSDETKIRISDKDRHISKISEKHYIWPEGTLKHDADKSPNRPVIVGMGPAGLFCAYMLSLSGCRPIVFERGKSVEERVKDVEDFFETGRLNAESNIQFGEGGAGTFSDGKLNTMVSDRSFRSGEVLRIFVKNGAPENILYDSKPHIGTDILRTVVKNMRKAILDNGGEIYFEHKLTYVRRDNDHIAATFNDNYEIDTCALVLATGHSARDTYQMLHDAGVYMQCKPFAVGLRVLHPQEMIDHAMYGERNLYDHLPPASYKLTHRCDSGKSVYSFCMCPGGYVINASSHLSYTAVNGMSYSGRAGEYANSGIIMGVDTADFGSDDIFAGMEFQKKLEKYAYGLAGGNIPIQSFGSYIKCNVDSAHLDRSGFKGSAVETDMSGLFDVGLRDAFIEGMQAFEHTIPGFSGSETILAGVESRTSSPVRITRDKEYMSSISGIYPCGEGAGYAGGITSAAMDGILIAEEIWKRHLIR